MCVCILLRHDGENVKGIVGPHVYVCVCVLCVGGNEDALVLKNMGEKIPIYEFLKSAIECVSVFLVEDT